MLNNKHWINLSRTLTSINGYKGLISWSGTAFEYLMPNLIMDIPEGSLIDESCEFAKEFKKSMQIECKFLGEFQNPHIV